ncbi:MAG TPA: MopE-related protein, partial [Flavobacteriaceae bacterium]|nr:MopE-related protein [Flavobacteriaceae bacterium]
CDDTEAASYPGNTEICDGIDNDCANGVDDGLVFLDYYPDSDEDGFGDESAIAENSCSPVSGKVADNTDCDDTMDTVYPGAPEIINDGIDQDCDGSDQTLGIDDFNLNNVLIHPNPFSNKLSIQLPNEFINYKIDIELFDLIGRSIFRLHKTANDSKIVISNMDDLPSGIYLMKISINEFNKSTVKRIIKD